MKHKNLIFIVILAVICLVSGGFATKTALEYRAEAQVYEVAQETFVTIPEQDVPLAAFPETSMELADPTAIALLQPNEAEATAELEESTILEPHMVVDFSALEQVNRDVVGWIYLPDTTVSYPILQGDTNNTYLYTAYDGSCSASGSLFLDYRVAGDFTAQNTVIYGHNIGNGTMFQPLMGYESVDFYEAHPNFWILTENGNDSYEICYVLVTAATSNVYDMTFPEAGDFVAHLDDLASQSLYDTGVTVTEQDLLVTLSTCISTDRDRRLVVIAKQQLEP